MKIFLCPVIVLASIFGLNTFPAAAQKSTTRGICLKIISLANSGGLSVELDNTSAKPIRIWNDANSWGAARWRVLVLRNGQLEGFFQNPNRSFSRNGPGFVEIAAGSHVEQKIDLNDGEWCGFGECSSRDQPERQGKKKSFNPGDVVVVIYDVPVTGEAHEMSVWYGVIATSTVVR
jgi:hypothetical protein